MLSEDAEYVNRAKLEAIIKACDACPSRADLSSLFRSEATCYVEEFQQWLLSHPNMASFTTWLLLEEMPGFSLEMEAESLTFYQILGQKYGGARVINLYLLSVVCVHVLRFLALSIPLSRSMIFSSSPSPLPFPREIPGKSEAVLDMYICMYACVSC